MDGDSAISLEELLRSRDVRVEHQRELLTRFPGASLICFTVILPGSVKRDVRSLKVAKAGVDALSQTFRNDFLKDKTDMKDKTDKTEGSQAKIRVHGHSTPQPCPSDLPSCHSGFPSCHSERSEESPVLYQEERDLATGFEAYLVVSMPPEQAKKLCCDIEDTHPLGRLMDIDVIVDSSTSPGMTEELSVRPLGRADIGRPERRCLLCGKPARECMRAHAHTQEEIQSAINVILSKSAE